MQLHHDSGLAQENKVSEVVEFAKSMWNLTGWITIALILIAVTMWRSTGRILVIEDTPAQAQVR